MAGSPRRRRAPDARPATNASAGRRAFEHRGLHAPPRELARGTEPARPSRPGHQRRLAAARRVPAATARKRGDGTGGDGGTVHGPEHVNRSAAAATATNLDANPAEAAFGMWGRSIGNRAVTRSRRLAARRAVMRSTPANAGASSNASGSAAR